MVEVCEEHKCGDFFFILCLEPMALVDLMEPLNDRLPLVSSTG